MVDTHDTSETVRAEAPPRRRRTGLVLLLGAVILLSGIALGAGGAMLWLKPPEPRSRGPGRHSADEIAACVAEQCGLDEEQTATIREVMARRLERLRAIHDDTAERILAEHDSLRQEMKAALTAEQFERWDEHFRGLQKRSPLVRRGRRGRSRWLRDPKEMFRRLDLNKDGKLTQGEVPELTWHRLSRADTDGDGAVTEEELRAFRGATPGPPGPHSGGRGPRDRQSKPGRREP